MPTVLVEVKGHRRSRNGRNFDVKGYKRKYSQSKVKPLPTKKGATSFGSEWEKNAAEARERKRKLLEENTQRVEKEQIDFYNKAKDMSDKDLYDYAYGKRSRVSPGHIQEAAKAALHKRGKLPQKGEVEIQKRIDAQQQPETPEETTQKPKRTKLPKTTKGRIKFAILNIHELRRAVKEAREVGKRYLEMGE